MQFRVAQHKHQAYAAARVHGKQGYRRRPAYVLARQNLVLLQHFLVAFTFATPSTAVFAPAVASLARRGEGGTKQFANAADGRPPSEQLRNLVFDTALQQLKPSVSQVTTSGPGLLRRLVSTSWQGRRIWTERTAAIGANDNPVPTGAGAHLRGNLAGFCNCGTSRSFDMVT